MNIIEARYHMRFVIRHMCKRVLVHVLFSQTFLSTFAIQLLIGGRTTELPFKNSVTTILLISLLNLAILFPSHIRFCTCLLTTSSREQHFEGIYR